jgi:predicted dinucleotide-binding enzyme
MSLSFRLKRAKGKTVSAFHSLYAKKIAMKENESKEKNLSHDVLCSGDVK